MRNTFFPLVKNLFLKRPTFNVLFLTNRCNLDCKMCFYTKREKRDELSTCEIDTLAKSLPPQWYIMLTGGEPFLRDDVVDIASSFYKRGALNLHISTNATLVDKTLSAVRAICKNSPKSRVIIVSSIDGPKEIHDGIRIRSGESAYDRTIYTLKEIIKMKNEFPNLGVATNFTLSSFNENYWKETINFLRDELKIDTVNIGLARGETKDEKAKEYNIENYYKAHRYLIKTNRRTYFAPLERLLALFKDTLQIDTIYKIASANPPKHYKCLAARVFSVITETGDVYPCELLSTKMGNLRDVNMNYNALWKSEKAEKLRKYIAKGECLCTYECAMTASLAASFSTSLSFADFLLNYKTRVNAYADSTD